MAALTSAQSGNFTASATWGGTAPSDGDTFTVTAGHSVTCSTVLMPTNGYGDITVHGKWSMISGSQFKLNGRATVYGGESNHFTEGESDSAGLWEMKPNSELVIKGTNSEQHALWCETEHRASIVCDGGEKNLNTVISCSGFLDYKQDYLPVATASNFAAGDWISVFSRFEGYQVQSDESFFVHDIDTSGTNQDKIYFRQFVSPTATILSTDNRRKIVVDNVKVFRSGYKVIFGTGDNRNVGTIVGIDFLRNFFIIDSDVNGSIVGETVYQTGNEKKHVNGFDVDLLVQSGSMVRRNATTLTTAIDTADSTADIVVGNASDMVVGDEIIIDVNNDTDTNWDYDTKYTINAIDGNTLTLDDQVRYTHKVGSLVNILTRDCVIRSEDADDRVFVYCEEWATTTTTSTLEDQAFTRRFRFRNVQFRGLGGNTNNNYYRAGFCLAGYNGGLDPTSSDTDAYGFQTEVDGCTWDGSATNATGNYRGIMIRRSYYATIRNNVAYDGQYNMMFWSSQYHMAAFGNYSTRSEYCTFYIDSLYQIYCAFSYNYWTRSDDYGILAYHVRSPVEMRHNIALNHEQRPWYNYYAPPNTIWERWFFGNHRSWCLSGEASGPHIFHDSKIENAWWGGTAKVSADGSGVVYGSYINGSQSYQTDFDRNRGKGGQQIWQEYQHEIDGLADQHGSLLREYLNDEGCWLCHNMNDSKAAYLDMVYVPPGTTVRLSCFVKTQSSGTFTQPYFFARSAHDMQLTGRRDDGAADVTNKTSTTAQDIGRGKGFYQEAQYTSDSQSDFEEKQLTIQPQKDGYYLNFGVKTTITNIREEPFKMKEPVVRFSQSGRGQQRLDTRVNTQPVIRTAFGLIKKRISGRI
jgi:hypothetical protein